MLSNIAFEQIDGNYWHGAYGEFKVVMMKDNGYINATKMCKSGGKDYKDWSRLKKSQSLIQSLQTYLTQKALSTTIPSSDLSIPSPDLSMQITDMQICRSQISPCISIMTNNKVQGGYISGTYVHPLLIPHIASWISNEFAIKVGEIVTDYILQEYKSKLSTIQQQLEGKVESIQQCEVTQEAMEKAIQETQ